MLRAVALTQYRRVTDRRTDGIAVASTALAMRALRRAVKRDTFMLSYVVFSLNGLAFWRHGLNNSGNVEYYDLQNCKM